MSHSEPKFIITADGHNMQRVTDQLASMINHCCDLDGPNSNGKGVPTNQKDSDDSFRVPMNFDEPRPSNEAYPNMVLSDKNCGIFCDALSNPPEPNEDLKKAYDRYHSLPQDNCLDLKNIINQSMENAKKEITDHVNSQIQRFKNETVPEPRKISYPLLELNHSWSVFLSARAKLIQFWHEEGYSDDWIAKELSMDEEQVYQIRIYNLN